MTYRIVKVRDVCLSRRLSRSPHNKKEPWAAQRQGSSKDLMSQSLIAGTPSKRTDRLLTAIGRFGRTMPGDACRPQRLRSIQLFEQA